MTDAQRVPRAAGDEIAASVVRSIAGYLRLSGALWIALGVVQVIALVTAIAGVWNIHVATSRFRIARAVEAREPWVPAAFEPLCGTITMGFINVVLGGAVGIVLVGLDVWIRHRVLASAAVFDPGFTPTSEAPTPELPVTYGQAVVEREERD